MTEPTLKELKEFIPKRWLYRWDSLPSYLRDLFLMRAKSRWRNQVYLPRLAKQKKEAERKRLQALRKPPAKVWRSGPYIIRWEPPDTHKELKPEGYWIWENHKGEWTQHGTLKRPHVREAPLYSNNEARVVTKYPQQALGEFYPSEVVPPYDG